MSIFVVHFEELDILDKPKYLGYCYVSAENDGEAYQKVKRYKLAPDVSFIAHHYRELRHEEMENFDAKWLNFFNGDINGQVKSSR